LDAVFLEKKRREQLVFELQLQEKS